MLARGFLERFRLSGDRLGLGDRMDGSRSRSRSFMAGRGSFFSRGSRWGFSAFSGLSTWRSGFSGSGSGRSFPPSGRTSHVLLARDLVAQALHDLLRVTPPPPCPSGPGQKVHLGQLEQLAQDELAAAVAVHEGGDDPLLDRSAMVRGMLVPSTAMAFLMPDLSRLRTSERPPR